MAINQVGYMLKSSLHLMSFLVEVHWRHFGPKHLILVGQIPQESKNPDVGGILAIFGGKKPAAGFWQFSAKNRRRRRDFGDFPAGGGGNLSTLGGTVATKCILVSRVHLLGQPGLPCISMAFHIHNKVYLK